MPVLNEHSYRTFGELLATVRSDLRSQDAEGFIDEGDLVKVAIRVNYELGLKINPTGQKIIDVENHRVKLPKDFSVLNYALVLGEPHRDHCDDYLAGARGTLSELRRLARLMNARPYEGTQEFFPGDNAFTHNLGTVDLVIRLWDMHDTPVPFTYRIVDENSIVVTLSSGFTAHTSLKISVLGAANASRCEIVIPECGDSASPCEIAREVCGTQIRSWKHAHRLVMLDKSENQYQDHSNTCYTGKLDKGFLETSFKSGSVYLNYVSLMESAEGELLVYDNPIINEYYEYACKQRIIENMMLSGEPVDKLYQLIEARYPLARAKALRLAHTPDFKEMHQTWLLNRKAQLSRFFMTHV